MAYVPVAQLKKKNTGYVPIAQLRGAKKNETSLTFTPLAQDERIFEPASLSTPKTFSGPTPQSTLKVLAQGTARQWAATGAKIAAATKIASDDKIDPRTFFGTSETARNLGVAIFGKAEPFNATSEDVEFLETFGTEKDIAEKTGGSLTILLSALDVIPGGAGAKGVIGLIRALKKADNITDAAKALRSVGFAEDVVTNYADIFVQAKKTKDVKKALDAATNLQSKIVKSGYRPVAEIASGAPAIKSVADELVTGAEEARARQLGEGGVPGRTGLQRVGLDQPLKKVITTEESLLKGKLRAESRAAKIGAKAGRAAAREEIFSKLRVATQATHDIKNAVVGWAKDLLEPKIRGKANVLIRDAKTPRDLSKAVSRIVRWGEDAEKSDLRKEIIDLQKSISSSPSIAIDYKARVKEFLGDFELPSHKGSTLERLKSTQEFLKREAEKGRDVEMPRRILQALSILNKTPLDKLTVNQLTGIKAQMELLEEIGRTKFRTMESIAEIQKTKILDEIAAQAAPQINTIPVLRPEIGERLTVTQKFKNFVFQTMNKAADVDRAITPMDAILDLLDGGRGTYAGANFRFFKARIDHGYGKYIDRKNSLQKPIIKLVEKYKLEDTNFERMGVVAARDQEGGMEKLIATGFTEAEVNAIKLTKEEQEVLDLMRSTFESQFDEIQDVMRRVYNQSVEKVKNYFSFMTDWKALDESEVFQRFGSTIPEQYGSKPRKNVEAKFTISRTGGAQKIKINAMDVFMNHTDNTSYLLELGEISKTLGEIAASPRYQELVGDAGQLMVQEWIDVVARKGGASGAQHIAMLDTLRKNVGAGVLGLKLSTILIQPTSLIDGAGFIGVKYAQKGITNFATNADWRKFVGEMPEIADRLGGEFAIRELTDPNWFQSIQRKGFVPMQALDQMTAGAIAAGAYERKMIELGKELDLTKYDPEALAYAQLAVRRTQSSGAFKDVPLAISRGALTGNRSLDRAILQFQNFLLTRWSRIRHDAIRAGITEKDPKKAIPIFTALLASAVVAGGIRLGTNRLIDFITGKEDEDSLEGDLMKNFLFETTGSVPFLGTATSMALYDGEMFPILDAPKGIVSGLNRAINSKSESAKLRGLTEFTGSVGVLFGIPGSTQAEQITRGFLQDEKSSPKGSSVNVTLKKIGLPPLPEPASLPKLPKLPAL